MGSRTDFFVELFQEYVGRTGAIVILMLVVLMGITVRFLRDLEKYQNLPENACKVATTIAGVVRRGAPPPNNLARWINALNEHFEGHAEILAASTSVSLHDNGLREPPGRFASLANEERVRLAREQKRNDPHAILEREPNWKGNPLLISYVTMDFASVRALREATNKPRVLSGNSVLVNPDNLLIYLERRPACVDTYPNDIHTFGGAFISHDPAVPRPPDEDLRARIYRWLLDESKVKPKVTKFRLRSDNTPIMMVRETKTGFIHGVLLGVTAAKEPTEGRRHYRTEEGDVLRIAFDALPDELFGEERYWVPSGKLHVLAWLAAGTPPCPGAQFGEYNADTLLREALSQAPRHLPP